MTKWTRQLEEEAVEAYWSGQTQTQIAERLGLSQTTVSFKLRQLGVPIRAGSWDRREPAAPYIDSHGYVHVTPSEAAQRRSEPSDAGRSP